jgi:molybdate transport system ATP-binding protein
VEPTLSPGDPVLVTMRPEAITVHARHPQAVSTRNLWPGVVAGMEMIQGRVRLQVDGAPAALVDVTAAAVAELRLRPGERIWLAAKAVEVEVYAAER